LTTTHTHLWLACNRLYAWQLVAGNMCSSVVDSIASNRSLAQVLYEYTDEELRETLKALVVFLLVI